MNILIKDYKVLGCGQIMQPTGRLICGSKEKIKNYFELLSDSIVEELNSYYTEKKMLVKASEITDEEVKRLHPDFKRVKDDINVKSQIKVVYV